MDIGAGMRIAMAAALVAVAPALARAEPWVIPPPEVDIVETGLMRAVFAAGCFWGVQGVYQHVTGVVSAVSGYAGGTPETARYDMVAYGRTTHAESVEVVYDPEIVSYGDLLQILFSVVHDPTQLNRQGPDFGPHYRSAIFPLSEEQEQAARAYIAQLDVAGIYGDPIVTAIEPFEGFYPAEDYHQDFLVRNPTYPYIVHFDLPKLRNLEAIFPEAYRAEPALVGAR